MTIFSHLLISAIAIKMLDIHGSDIGLALLFGNAIDLDHIWKWKDFPKTKRKTLKNLLCMPKGHTVIHKPIFVLAIILMSYLLHSPIPLIFWLLHMLADYLLLRSEKQPGYPFNQRWYTFGLFPLNSRYEYLIDCLLTAIFFWLLR